MLDSENEPLAEVISGVELRFLEDEDPIAQMNGRE